MDEIVKKEILKIRDSGLVNLLDVNAVQVIANEKGFYSLVVYIEEHRQEYFHFILTGELNY